MSEAGFAIVYDDADGQPPRRLRFEPRAADNRWRRYEDEWNGCRWRSVGSSVCEHVEVECAGAP